MSSVVPNSMVFVYLEVCAKFMLAMCVIVYV